MHALHGYRCLRDVIVIIFTELMNCDYILFRRRVCDLQIYMPKPHNSFMADRLMCLQNTPDPSSVFQFGSWLRGALQVRLVIHLGRAACEAWSI